MINQIFLENICRQFSFQGRLISVDPYGDGHINDTYKVTYENEFEEQVPYILQRVNHEIFKETEKLMLNIENITLYLQDIVKELEIDNYDILELIRTQQDKCYYKHQDGTYWRAYVFIKHATGHTFAENNELLTSAGEAFGEFQLLLKDYPVEKLHETIKDFHHTPNRLRALKAAVEEDKMKRLADCRESVDFAFVREAITSKVLEGIEQGKIPLRVTHNDTKLNNVLIDDKTLKGRCVIDLDTVMPGSALYDFGDAIRSCGSSVAEDEEDLDKLEFDVHRFEAYTSGFLRVMAKELSDTELDLLPDAAILMTLECGMRFLTDHLEGDTYFKIHKPKHNLIRAKNQFKFVERMEASYETMVEIVNRYR